MNLKEHAEKWADLELQIAELKKQQKEHESVLVDSAIAIGESKHIGNAYITYRTGRKKYDYETAAIHAPVDAQEIEAAIDDNKSVDWRGVCKSLKIDKDDVPYEQGSPSASVKFKLGD